MKTASNLCFLIALFLFFTSVSLLASDSGWNEYADYKYEKLLNPGLEAVHFSDDGSKFYTYNTDSTIRIWNTATGKLLDSIVLSEKPTYFFFSSDGKTAIYAIWMDSQSYSTYNLKIVDIVSKKIIGHSAIDLFKAMKPNEDAYPMNYSFKILKIDDFFESKLLYVSYYSELGKGGADGTIFHYDCGASGLFKLSEDSLIFEAQILKNQAIDMYFLDNSIYYSTDFYSTAYKGNYDVRILESTCQAYDIVKFVNHQIIKFNWSYSYDHGNQAESGHYESLPRVFFDQKDSIVLIKSGQHYYYYSLTAEKIIDTLWLNSQDGIERITRDYKLIISYLNNKFYFYNISSKLLMDSLSCPIKGNNFITLPAGNGLLAYNSIGEMVLLKADKPKEIINFNTRKNWYYTGDSIQFFNTSSASAKKIHWNFGDGDSSSVSNPVHVYKVRGNYTVTLTITDNIDSTYILEKKNYLEILQKLKADFKVLDSVGNSPFTVKFYDASSGDINSYFWDFGDFSTGSGPNPQHIYIDPGHYSVSLVIYDKYNEDSVYKEELIIIDYPKPDSLLLVKPYSITDWAIDGIIPSDSNEVRINNIQGFSNLHNSAVFSVTGDWINTNQDTFPVNAMYYIDQIKDSIISLNSDTAGLIGNYLCCDKTILYNDDNSVTFYLNSKKKLVTIDYQENLLSELNLYNPCTAFNKHNGFSYIGTQNKIYKTVSDTVLIDSIKVTRKIINIFPSAKIVILEQDNNYYQSGFSDTILISEKGLIDGADILFVNKFIQQRAGDGFIGVGYTDLTSGYGNTNGWLVSFNNNTNVLNDITVDDYSKFNNITMINDGQFLVTGDSKHTGFIILDSNLTRVKDYRYFNTDTTYKFFGAIKLNDNQFIIMGTYTNKHHGAVKSDNKQAIIEKIYTDENSSFDKISIIKVQIPGIFTSVTTFDNIGRENSLSIFPNPAENLLNISLKTSEVFQTSEVSARAIIYDVLGNIKNEFSYPLTSNNSIITIDINNLEQGIYIVKVIINDKILVGKFVRE